MNNSNDPTNNHSMPPVDLEQQKRGRRLFLLMFVIFFGPFLLAALAKNFGWFVQQDTVNYGTLLEPSVQVTDASLQSSRNDQAVQLREKWSLVVSLPAGCADECIKTLREIEAIHLLLNRDIQRVQLLLIDDMDVEVGVYTHELQNNPALEIVRKEFSQAVPHDAHGLQGTYLVDPKGFLVMHYPQILESKKLQKDLKRLLKYSRIG
ncbi:MAG: hypothetical protein HKO58_09950 [Gammaproteobacteria bacterium]|nr:hypothetical protein [Gammaproteobacteria bacterium]